MKNLQILESRDDVTVFAGSIWRTLMFRELHEQQGSYLQRIIDLFADKPRIYYDMDDPALERNHFTVWMNAIQIREPYQNPYLEDMYNLHEMQHLNTMIYNARSNLFEWSTRSLVNELDATIETEVVIYFAIPGLREKTFPFEIWADRFLKNEQLLSDEYDDNHRFFARDPKGFREALMKRRWRIRHQPTPGDRIEEMISGYVQRNDAWDEIWVDVFPEIDQHMEEFEADCSSDRAKAIHAHAHWLLYKKGSGICPYQKQAEEYVKVAEHFKQKFAEQTVDAAQKNYSGDHGMNTI